MFHSSSRRPIRYFPAEGFKVYSGDPVQSPESKVQSDGWGAVRTPPRQRLWAHLDTTANEAAANLLPLPARHERGEGWGEGIPKTALLSPALSSLGGRR